MSQKTPTKRPIWSVVGLRQTPVWVQTDPRAWDPVCPGRLDAYKNMNWYTREMPRGWPHPRPQTTGTR